MALNPCNVILYPAAASVCATGCSSDAGARPALGRAAVFVLGNAIAMTCLGVLASLLGGTVSRLGGWFAYAVAAVPIVMGAHLLGLIRLRIPTAVPVGQASGFAGAFVGGLAFALVLGPCGTPALAAILSYAALKSSVLFGGVLLFAYGAGNGVPLLLVGGAMGKLAARAHSRGWGRYLERGSGVAMIALGYFLIWTA